MAFSDGATLASIRTKLNAVLDPTWTTFTPTLGASTTAPTKATTHTIAGRYRVVDKWMWVKMYYFAASASGAASGSGEYLWTVPNSETIDTAQTGTAGVGTVHGIPWGTGSISTSGVIGGGANVLVFDSTRLKLVSPADVTGTLLTHNTVSATHFGLVAAQTLMTLDAQFPIT